MKKWDHFLSGIYYYRFLIYKLLSNFVINKVLWDVKWQRLITIWVCQHSQSRPIHSIMLPMVNEFGICQNSVKRCAAKYAGIGFMRLESECAKLFVAAIFSIYTCSILNCLLLFWLSPGTHLDFRGLLFIRGTDSLDKTSYILHPKLAGYLSIFR